MGISIAQIDAFTARPFAGNPAAVCLLPAVRDDTWMQALASEMNLSETAFLIRREDAFDLRWFSPAMEIDLCGHATLASAHYLWESGLLAHGEQARFHTRSGLLTADQRDDWIELDFPSTPATEAEAPEGLVVALGVDARFVGRTRFDYLVETGSETAIRKMSPDMARLAHVEARGIMVTAKAASPDYDFVSRFFAPATGIPEDPVTGSAHCALAPFWAERLGKDVMTAFQASPRGGVVRVRLAGDRIKLGGQAVTVFTGALRE